MTNDPSTTAAPDVVDRTIDLALRTLGKEEIERPSLPRAILLVAALLLTIPFGLMFGLVMAMSLLYPPTDASVDPSLEWSPLGYAAGLAASLLGLFLVVRLIVSLVREQLGRPIRPLRSEVMGWVLSLGVGAPLVVLLISSNPWDFTDPTMYIKAPGQLCLLVLFLLAPRIGRRIDRQQGLTPPPRRVARGR